MILYIEENVCSQLIIFCFLVIKKINEYKFLNEVYSYICECGLPRAKKGQQKVPGRRQGLGPSRCYYSLAKRNGILFGLAIIN